MPPKKKQTSTPNKKTGTERWGMYSTYAAQLFRDLYFKKYTRKDDGKFDRDAIYFDPTRDYTDLNLNAFYKHIVEIDAHVQAYRTNGTGLGTSEFRRLCNLNKVPPPEDRGQDWDKEDKEKEEETKKDKEEVLSSDVSDSTYFGAKEDHVELGSSFEEESEEEEEDKKMPAKKKISVPSSLEKKKKPTSAKKRLLKWKTSKK